MLHQNYPKGATSLEEGSNPKIPAKKDGKKSDERRALEENFNAIKNLMSLHIFHDIYTYYVLFFVLI